MDNKREIFGHWEADTIIGKGHQGAIVTLDERISKLRMSYPVNSKQASKVANAISHVLKLISEWVESITYDNGKGKEFAKHE